MPVMTKKRRAVLFIESPCIIIATTATWQRSVVVSVLASITVLNRQWARLVLGWVTVCEQVNHLGM